jgi:hypothetical protein
MRLSKHELFYNTKDVEFVFSNKYLLLKEDQSYVPRFSVKDVSVFKDIPMNKPVKYSEKLLLMAIKYGMIFQIQYKGAEDKSKKGNERVIYPMVYGRSAKGAPLLRGFHLNGWSVSENKHVNKIWRMFRTDRIVSLTFTGSFYRLPPAGYKMHDKGMRGGIIAYADFNQIRKNQQNLLQQQVIQSKEETTLGGKDKKFVSIQITPTDSILDMLKPFENAYISNIKDVVNIRISFLKSIYGNKYIAVLGAMGEPGNTVKVISKGKTLGVYKVLDSITGDVLKKIKNIKGNTVYDLYVFDKKL